jgi:hypothetical protein
MVEASGEGYWLHAPKLAIRRVNFRVCILNVKNINLFHYNASLKPVKVLFI